MSAQKAAIRRRGAAVAVATVAALLLVALVPASALAVTRDAAVQTALAKLTPDDDPGTTVVFATRRPLSSRVLISEASGKGGKLRERPLGQDAWLFYKDQAYGAAYEHPGEFMAVARSGATSAVKRTMWYPLVNGRRPSFLRSADAYASEENQVFSDFKQAEASGPRAASASADPPLDLAQDGFNIGTEDLNEDCMITISDPGKVKGNNNGDNRFRSSVDAMHAVAGRIGLRSYRSPPSVKGLEKTVDEVIAQQPCRDVLIYIAGHGIPPKGQTTAGPLVQTAKGGDAGVVIGNHVEKQKDGTKKQTLKKIGTPDLVNIVAKHRDVTFKFKIFSCFSGRFRPVLDAEPNVVAFEGSSAERQASFFHLPAVVEDDPATGRPMKISNTATNVGGTPASPGLLGVNGLVDGFTNGNAIGLLSWAQDPREGRTLVDGLKQSLEDGAQFDFPRELLYTTPTSFFKKVTLMMNFAWAFHPNPNEVTGTGTAFLGQPGGRAAPSALAPRQSTAPLDAVRVTVSPRQITNHLCPAQLPSGQVSTTSNPSDTLTCSGGTLPLGDSFTLNVQTVPAPTAGMGGQVFGRQQGSATFAGPFSISGP